jgi:Zn ribbon nucleic-acid-binding protein
MPSESRNAPEVSKILHVMAVVCPNCQATIALDQAFSNHVAPCPKCGAQDAIVELWSEEHIEPRDEEEAEQWSLWAKEVE